MLLHVDGKKKEVMNYQNAGKNTMHECLFSNAHFIGVPIVFFI
jgi:hypothetical protein